MVEVDWATLFKSFYKTVRVKIACKNYTRIPLERMYEMNKKLHVVSFTVEAESEGTKTKTDENDDDGGDDGHKDGDEEADDLYDTDNEEQTKKDTSASDKSSFKTPVTKPSNASGSKTVSRGAKVVDPFDQERQLKEYMESF